MCAVELRNTLFRNTDRKSLEYLASSFLHWKIQTRFVLDFPTMENPDEIRVGFSFVGKSRRDSCWIFHQRRKIQTRFVLDFPSVFELGSGVVTDVLPHVLTCDVLVRAASFPAWCCVHSWNGVHAMSMIVYQQPVVLMCCRCMCVSVCGFNL